MISACIGETAAPDHSAGEIAAGRRNDLHPARSSVATFACVAGWFHMFTFIAGANRTGAVVARYMVERKSSARPCANFASISAVAGATSNELCGLGLGDVFDRGGLHRGHAASRRGPERSNDLMTGESREGQRPTNSSAARVITTCGSKLSLLQRTHEIREPCRRRCLRIRQL